MTVDYRYRQPCAECGKRNYLAARGLCSHCYKRNRRAGTLANFPTLKNRQRGSAPVFGQGSPIPGLTYRQVDYWVRRGYLRPEHATDGSGSVREWPAEELAVGERMGRLVAAGMAPVAAAVAARHDGPVEIAPGVWVGLADLETATTS